MMNGKQTRTMIRKLMASFTWGSSASSFQSTTSFLMSWIACFILAIVVFVFVRSATIPAVGSSLFARSIAFASQAMPFTPTVMSVTLVTMVPRIFCNVPRKSARSPMADAISSTAAPILLEPAV